MSHALPDAPCATDQAPYPVVLNSPGRGVPRSACAETGPNLASHGYVVVSVDHYDSVRTVFPDGTYYVQGDAGLTSVGNQDRVRDLVFILDELARWNMNDPVFAGRLDLTKVTAMGGSRGGVTAAQFGGLDNRCKAVIGLDPGTFSAAPELQRVEHPVLEISRGDNGSTTLYGMGSQAAIWFQISNTDHVLIAGVDWYWAWHPENVAGGREVARTINAYTLWFLNKHLKGRTDPMPALTSYPRVTGFQQK